MPLPLVSVTPIYGALLAFLLIILAVKVIKLRRMHKVPLQDGGVDDLTCAIRAHANFTEYVPLTLLLMAIAEANGLPQWSLHLVGVTLIAGRVIHAKALYDRHIKRRVIGMSCTFTALALSAILSIASIFVL